MSNRREALNSILRTDFFSFVCKTFETLKPGGDLVADNYLRLMCFVLEQCAAGEITRQLITIPPRYLKSMATSIALPAWILGHNPSAKILVVSYSLALAKEHSLNFKEIIESTWYRELFPNVELHPRRNTGEEIWTSKLGGRRAVSPGSSTTGFGAEFIIIDDIIDSQNVHSEVERANVKQYIDGTLLSRFNDQGTGRVIAIQQRLHEDDPAAYLINKGTFEHLNLTAIAEEEEQYELKNGDVWIRKRGEALCPDRQSIEDLERIRQEMGDFIFSSQYQQNPIAPDGNQISWQTIPRYAETPPHDRLIRVVQSWDTACTVEPESDYSVCSTWGFDTNQNWYLLDVYRRRHEYADLRDSALRLARRWNANVIVIEAANSGRALISDLKREFKDNRRQHKPIIAAYKPRQSKEERFFTHKHHLEQRSFLFPENAAWLPDLKHELQAFPSGKYDDQVDSIIQFLCWLDTPRGRGFMNRDPVSGRRHITKRKRRQLF